MEKKLYDAEYHRKNIKGVYIPFNMANPEDVKLLAYVREHPNVTEYLKLLVFLDMKENAPEV